MFAEKLKAAMAESKVSATELAALTGIHKASISQYLHGKVDPPADKKERLACALGKAPDYFKQEEIRALIKGGDPRLKPEIAAKLMHIGKDALCQALQDGTLNGEGLTSEDLRRRGIEHVDFRINKPIRNSPEYSVTRRLHSDGRVELLPEYQVFSAPPVGERHLFHAYGEKAVQAADARRRLVNKKFIIRRESK